MAEGDAGGIGSTLAWVAAARETRAAGDSGRTDTGLAGTAVLHEYAPLHCSGPRKPTLIPVTYYYVPVTQGLAMGLAPAPSL